MDIPPEVFSEFSSLLDDDVKKRLTRADGNRFLRARKGDASKAAAMAKEWFVWRSTPLTENGTVTPDNILDSPEDPNEDIYKRLMPHANMCEDKMGRPLYYEQTGLISSRFAEISSLLSNDDLTLRHVRQQELMVKRLHHASVKHGRPIEKQIVVFNLANLSYAVNTNAMSVFRRTVQIDEAYYPERLQHFFMINAPWFFTAVWSLIQPWIDPVTSDKINIVGSDYLPTLREHIDDSEIPPELGGSAPNFTYEAPFPEEYGASNEQIAAKVDWGPTIYDEENESNLAK